MNSIIIISFTFIIDSTIRRYSLQAIVFSGVELPLSESFHVRISIGKPFLLLNIIIRLFVESLGHHTKSTSATKNQNGQWFWMQHIELEVIELPKDVTQIPDIFIYLVREGHRKCVCFKVKTPS